MQKVCETTYSVIEMKSWSYFPNIDEDIIVCIVVPLSTMVGYASILRSITAGHASMTMAFARYAR